MDAQLDELPKDIVIDFDKKLKPKTHKKKKEKNESVQNEEGYEEGIEQPVSIEEDPNVLRAKIKSLVANNLKLASVEMPPEIKQLDKMTTEQLKNKLEAIQFSQDFKSTSDISSKVLEFGTGVIDRLASCDGKFQSRCNDDAMLQDNFNQVLSSELFLFLTAKAKVAIALGSNLIGAVLESRQERAIMELIDRAKKQDRDTSNIRNVDYSDQMDATN